MLTLHPEYLKKNGKPEFVVIPYDEYQALEEILEDREDERAFREAKAEHIDSGAPTKSLRELEAELSIN